jgi:hypothetical protein
LRSPPAAGRVTDRLPGKEQGAPVFQTRSGVLPTVEAPQNTTLLFGRFFPKSVECPPERNGRDESPELLGPKA